MIELTLQRTGLIILEFRGDENGIVPTDKSTICYQSDRELTRGKTWRSLFPFTHEVFLMTDIEGRPSQASLTWN